MFGIEKKEVNKETALDKVTYNITVDAVRATKNDKILMLDLIVNGIWIKSCMLKEVEVTKDGEKYKKGDTCYILTFPSEKVGEKYYNRVWFPISNNDMDVIINQVKSLL